MTKLNWRGSHEKNDYTTEFKDEAVKQVIYKGHPVPVVAQRLGAAEGLLYTWVKKPSRPLVT